MSGSARAEARRGTHKRIDDSDPIEDRRCCDWGKWLLVVVAFSVNVCLTNAVKYVFKTYEYPFPMFVSSLHMIVSGVTCWSCIYVFGIVPKQKRMGIGEQIKEILPFSIFGACSIASGNKALVYLFPSFHEMLQATTPVSTLIVATLLAPPKYSCWAWLAMIPVCGGAALSVNGEQSKYEVVGLLWSFAAVWFRALKAHFQAKSLETQLDAITLVMYMAPWNFAIFASYSVIEEGSKPWEQLKGHEEQTMLLVWIGFGCALAAAYNVVTFLMIGKLSAVGCMVMHNAKTPAVILASLFLFENTVTPIQLVGFSFTFFGVYLFNKYGKSEKAPGGGGGGKQARTVDNAQDLEMDDDLDDDLDDEDDEPDVERAPPSRALSAKSTSSEDLRAQDTKGNKTQPARIGKRNDRPHAVADGVKGISSEEDEDDLI